MDTMSEQTQTGVMAKVRGAAPNINKSIQKWTTALALFLAGTPATAAAQVEGETNPLTEFIMAVSGELIIPAMIGCLVVGALMWFASSMVRNPQTASDLKRIRNAAFIGVVGVPLSMAFFDYIAPLLPFGVGETIDFTGLF